MTHTRRLLARFERDIAGNGKIAIEKLQKKSYDIIKECGVLQVA